MAPFSPASCGDFPRVMDLARRVVEGLLLALDLKGPIGPSIVTTALQDGLLLNAPRQDSLRFMPALNVTRDEIIQMTTQLDAILGKLGSGVVAA